jgi:hypothetical protein
MGEHNSNNQIYPALAKLSIEELQNLLSQDFYSSDDVDMEYITAILAVIEQREAENIEAEVFDIETGWKSFEESYMCAKITEPNFHKTEEPAIYKTFKRSKRKIWQMAAAAVMVVFLGGVITAQALGYNIFQVIAQWTDELFILRGTVEEHAPPKDMIEIPPDMEFETIREVLDELDVLLPVVPHWHPDGFVQTHLQVLQQLPDFTMVDAVFENEDRLFIIGLTIYNELSERHTMYFPKDDSPVREYISWGIMHYIFSNNDNIVAVWEYDNVEGSITGSITEDELIRMIDSIYGG